MTALEVVNGVGVLGLAWVLHSYRTEFRALRAVLRRLHAKHTATGTALEWAAVVHKMPRRLDTPFLPGRVFDILGGTPGGILQQGGCCSGLSRLYIAGLETLDIPATHVILYHASGVARHCLTEVSVEGKRFLVDPFHGFYYEDRDGQPVSIEALRLGRAPQYRSLPGITRDAYPRNDYHDFAFTETKTANWTKTRLRRAVYWILSRLTAGRIATYRRPVWCEWPQLVVAVGMAGMLLAVNGWIWWAR